MSVFGRLPRGEQDNLRAAAKARKYWNMTRSEKRFVYVVALSRARVRVGSRYYARTNAFDTVCMSPEVAGFCRKYRVLLVDKNARTAICAITWSAFVEIVRKHSQDLHEALVQKKLPAYVNSKILNTVLRSCGDGPAMCSRFASERD